MPNNYLSKALFGIRRLVENVFYCFRSIKVGKLAVV
jgi:hypothetical protein